METLPDVGQQPPPVVREYLKQLGSRGGSATAKRPDTAERMARARESWLDQLADRVDPDHHLTPESRRAVAIAARADHLAKARQARAERRAAGTGGAR